MKLLTQNKINFPKLLSQILVIGLLAVAFLGFFAAAWYVDVYGRIGFDSIIFTLTSSLGGVDAELVTKFCIGAVLPAVLCTAVVSFLLFGKVKGKYLLPISRSAAANVSLILSIGLLVHGAFNSQLIDYMVSSFSESELYESEYRDPAQVTVTFPEEKRNLIYIYLESMETSYQDKTLGGALEYNLIPELTQLAQENVNFSHNTSVGGFRQTSGTSWTIGAMVAHTAGIPLKVPDGIDDWQNGYGKDGVFLPGVTSITSILQEQGYYQSLMVGSVASFGGRDTYYLTHGADQIYDLVTARQVGVVPYNYWNDFWGMEDLYLFEYAKQELTEISQKDQPFAFTMLTVDTHHIGGFTCALCGNDHEESYENAISCSSRQVMDFVNWLKEQPFYDNTTIVITGDHCSMDAGYFDRNVDEDYVRHVYNCFINAAATPHYTQNRQFNAMDLFPTTLAAMGCTIEGDRLGLGVNLFSIQPTLTERFGYAALYNELAQKSDYYAEHFYE